MRLETEVVIAVSPEGGGGGAVPVLGGSLMRLAVAPEGKPV